MRVFSNMISESGEYISESGEYISECNEYNIQHLLNTDLILSPITDIKVNIIPFQINHEGLHPFLQFFLFKDKIKNSISFLTFNGIKFLGSELLETCSTILDILFLSYSRLEPLYKYVGKMMYNEEMYIFFDCSNYKIQCHAIQDDIWLALTDEIVNYKKIYKYDIDSLVSEFFLNNTGFLSLGKESMDITSIMNHGPIVAYISCSKKKVDFISTFGQVPGKYGHYYFTSYDNATKEEACVIRFALFTGIMNLEIDNEDLCDSFYVNGEWILKNYNQQIALSSHY